MSGFESENETEIELEFGSGPLDNSHWVIKGCLLASAYPGDRDFNEHLKKLRILKKTEINIIVSMMEKGEEDNFNEYRSILAKGEVIMPKDNKYGYSEITQGGYTFIRLQTKDMNVTNDTAVKNLADRLAGEIEMDNCIMIHCFGGKGRTGVMCGVILGELFEIVYDEIILVLNEAFKTRIHQGNKTTIPQTSAQRAQIKRLINN